MSQGEQGYIAIPPDLNSWLRLMMQNFSANINCCSLGTINSFNAANQTATISINYQRVFTNANPNPSNLQGETQPQNTYKNYPLLVQCPVVVMQGGGAYLTFPIAVGDTCLVLFNDREITTWLTTGQVTYPHSPRVHDLSDGIALIGIRNILNPIPNYNTTVAVLSDQTGNRLTQSGMMVAYGGSVAPSGWLLCQGQLESTTTYPNLFAVIGYTYGGSGGNFNLPDMRGQVPVGIGGTLGLTLGQEFGMVTHTLTIPEMPPHQHSIPLNNGTSGGNPALPAENPNASYTGDSSMASGSTGGGGPHNNVQPSLGLNWLIKI